MVIIYILFFFIWFLAVYRKHGVSMQSYILALYCVGVLACSILMTFYSNTIIHKERITFSSVTFHCFCMFLLLFPVVYNGSNIRIGRLKIDKSLLKLYYWLIIIPSVLSIILSSFDVVKIFAFNNLLDARNAFLSGDVSNLYVERYGLIGYVASLGQQLSFLSMFFLFYQYFVKKERSMITLLLFISSFSMVVNNLAIAGRDGIVRWFIFLGICLVLFKKYYSYKEYKKLFLILTVAGTVLIIPFFLITTDRYGESDEGALYSVFRYLGEPYYLFSYDYNRFYEKGFSEVGILFPIITQKTYEMYNLNSVVLADYHLNSFSTMAGSFVKRAGVMNCLAVCICWFVISFLILYKPNATRRRLSLGYLVTYLFLVEIVVLGMFYYMHGARFTQLTILLYILIAICLQGISDYYRSKV